MGGDDPATTAASLWYFAYGSNLDPRTFVGRRKMRPAEVRVAWLPGFELVFDLPAGPGERGFANLRSSPESSVCGVAYRIDLDQSRHLDRTEGVPKAYRRHGVDLEDLEGGRFRGFTYVSEHRQPERKPSPRYLGLLLHGARHHGLPEEYVAYLRDFDLAVDERTAQLDLIPRSDPGAGSDSSRD